MIHLRLVSSRKNYEPLSPGSIALCRRSPTSSMPPRVIRLHQMIARVAVSHPIAFDVLEKWVEYIVNSDTHRAGA